MFCTNCGKEINNNAKFCPHCGGKNELMDNGDSKESANVLPKADHEKMPSNTLPKAQVSANSVIPKQIESEHKQQSNSSTIPPQTNNSQQENNTAPINTVQQSNNQYRQIAENRGRRNNSNTVNNRRLAKPQTGDKGLKTIFFVLLAVAGLFAVGAFITLFLGVNSPVDISSILEGDPKVEREVFEDWDKGEYSINNIGAKSINSAATKYVGVWQLQGLKMNVNDSTYSVLPQQDSDKAYVVIDTNNYIHSIITDNAGTILSHKQKAYRIENDKFVSDAGDDALAGAYLQYEIVNQELAICTMIEGVQSSDWAIYNKTNYEVDYMLNLAAAIQQTETVTDDNASQSFEIEKKIIGAWEADLENIGIYYGCEFYSDGTFWYVEIQDGQRVTDTIYTYEFVSDKQMILDGNKDVVFDVYLEYSNQYGHNILYITSDVEIMELYEVDNLNPPDTGINSDDTQSSPVNIVEYIEGKTWISTGNEHENEYASSQIEGYPKTYDLAYGELVYSVDNGVITSQNTSTEYVVLDGNEFIKAFSRNVTIDGGSHEMYSIFFAGNGYLYEIEMMDTDQVSNIIELEVYEP